MEETTTQPHPADRVPSASTSTSSAGDRALMPDNLTEQPLSLQDERIVSANPSPDAAITGPSKNITDQPETSNTSGTLYTVYPENAYSPVEQTYYYGASCYDNGNNNMGEYSNYINANSLQAVPPGVYNENPSLLFHSAYGFDTQMPYGQFSPMASPLSPIILDGQLYSPHQIPVSPPYYPPVSPGLPHATSALSVSQTELMTPGNISQEALSDNTMFGPGSCYFVQFGSFGGGNLSGNSNVGLYKFPGDFGPTERLSNRSNPSDSSSFLPPLTSAGLYPPPVGILGQYEHNVAQVSQPQPPYHGLGLVSSTSTRPYPQGSSYRSSNYGGGSISHWDAGRLTRPTPERGGRRNRDHDSVSVSADSHVISSDRNRGPRASKPKGKISIEEKNVSPGVSKNGASTSGHHLDGFNQSDFITDYVNAKFFVIKSFSEDNVHKSVKYSVWASTPLGNRKLDAAYHEAKELKDNCPVFLLFSVNASGQFCGVAEMAGTVDFENDADYWLQDRWSGQFPVKWHIIKDVPNSRFRHILLENNDNKPVTHSRDSQEVKLEHGIEMLKIFKDYEADTSILDDFNFYDEREKVLRERKARQRTSTTNSDPVVLPGASINKLSDNLADTLRLGESQEVPKVE